eukprot:9486178-Pyramimonas_sp.AAC.3
MLRSGEDAAGSVRNTLIDSVGVNAMWMLWVFMWVSYASRVDDKLPARRCTPPRVACYQSPAARAEVSQAHDNVKHAQQVPHEVGDAYVGAVGVVENHREVH